MNSPSCHHDCGADFLIDPESAGIGMMGYLHFGEPIAENTHICQDSCSGGSMCEYDISSAQPSQPSFSLQLDWEKADSDVLESSSGEM